MLSLSPLAVASSLPAKQTSADKALHLIDPAIRKGREEVLTDLFNEMRVWRVNPHVYNCKDISTKLNGHISALNQGKTCSAIQLNEILKVALKFAEANKGKGFTSNNALITVLNEQLKELQGDVRQENRILFLKPVLASLSKELKKQVPEDATEEERQILSKRQEQRQLLREVAKTLMNQVAGGADISEDLPYIQKLQAALREMNKGASVSQLDKQIHSACQEALTELIKPYSNRVQSQIQKLQKSLEFYVNLKIDSNSNKEIKITEEHNCSVLIPGFKKVLRFLSQLEKNTELHVEKVNELVDWLKEQKISLESDIDAYEEEDREQLTKAEKFYYENARYLDKTIKCILPLLQAQLPEQERTDSCGSRFFSTALKVAGLGMLLILGGLNAYLAFKPSAPVPNGLQPAPFLHYDGNPAFFDGDLLVDEQGAKPLYCPSNAREACERYAYWTRDILRNPSLLLPPNPYTEKANGTMQHIRVSGNPLPVAPGGELTALNYIEELYGQRAPEGYFSGIRLRMTRLWANATQSPLTGENF